MPVLGVTEGQIVSTPEPDIFAKDWPAAWPGSIRTTCGSTEAKYGTRAIAAAENSRVPPGRPERRLHAAYVRVELVIPMYLTLE